MPYNIYHAAAFDYLQAFKRFTLPDVTSLSAKDKAEYENLIEHIAKIQGALKDKNLIRDNPSEFLALYTRLHEIAEKITVKENPDAVLKNDLLAFHKQFFISLYENDSKLFERIDQRLIKDTKNNSKSRETHIHGKLDKHNIRKPGVFDFAHPENWANKLFSGLFGIDYNPLKRTNMPYISFPSDGNGPTTLRMGTQVQGMRTLQPSFQNYLGAKNTLRDQNKKFHHVYFNLLKRDRGDFERYFESVKTKALESLNDMPLGAAVITLPADSHSFVQGFSKETGRAKGKDLFKTNDIEKELIDSIMNSKNDFHIPEEIKKIIFAEGLENEVSKLYAESLNFVTGDMPPALVNAETRQAILFDFVKFRLSNFIVEKLNPDTINFSCKDAIDRGGVHALWFEMRRRMEKGTPMDEAEFNMHLDASALLVKGRPVNDHRVLIWNTLKESYSKSPEMYKQQPWVHEWLIKNYPIPKEINKLQKKSNLSSKEQAHLNEHMQLFKTFKDNIAHLQPTVEQPKVVQFSVDKEPLPPQATLSHLQQFKNTNSPFDYELEPAVEQSQNSIQALHSVLKKAENKGELGISNVKARKAKENEEQPGISFDLKAKERQIKVVAKPNETNSGTVFYAKKQIPIDNFEAFALSLSEVVLTSAKPGATLNFSGASAEKRAILEDVFDKAIKNAISNGKFTPENAPRIVKPDVTPVLSSTAKKIM